MNQLKVTRVVIAHRPETVASVQRVVVAENGTVQLISSRPNEVKVTE